MDAVLMFEVLLYLNAYFFGLFCVAELVILLAKCLSPVLCIPNIGRDAAVLVVVFASELLKLQGFKRSRERSRSLSNVLAISTSMLSISGLLYILAFQTPVLKMEYIICSIMLVFVGTIVVYGFLQLFSCCKENQFA